MDLSISQMMSLQLELLERNQDKWPPMAPEQGKDHLLYMIEEMGEVIAILKKKGCGAVLEDPQVRAAFVEEMADVLMYYHEVLLRFQVTPEEISQAYQHKHDRNMGRNYPAEYEELYHG